MSKTIKKVVKVAAPIALGFIAGPAIGGALSNTFGVTSAVGQAALTGASGGFVSGLASGQGIEGALKGTALGLLGGAVAGKFGAGGAGATTTSDVLAAAPSGVNAAPVTDYLTGATSASPLAAATATPSFGTGDLLQFGGSAAGGGGLDILEEANYLSSTPQFNQTGAGAAPTSVTGQQTGFVGKLNEITGMDMTKGDLIRGGLNVGKSLLQQSQMGQLAEQMAQQADPFQAQRGQAVAQGLQAVTDPYNNPLYNQTLAQAEKALKRRQAASGNYYSGGAMEDTAQLPANVVAALQQRQVQAAGNVASAAQGSPGTGAQLYGTAKEKQGDLTAGLLEAALAPYDRRMGQAKVESVLNRLYGVA